MMKTFALLWIAPALFSLGSLRAQSPSPAEKPVLPSGPLVQKKAPDFSRWVITARVLSAKPQDKTAAAVATETTVTVTKTGKVVHMERTDEQHNTWQTWCRGATQVAVAPGNQVYFVAPPPNKDVVNPLYFDFSKSDFEGFDWISAQNFTGIQPVMGFDCLVFKDNRNVTGALAPESAGSAPGAAPAAPVMNALVACINAETRLPVALMNDNGVVTYRFEKPPDAMQEFPPNVQALLDKQKLDALSVKRKASSPY
jgi:hypothetical protein